MRKFNSNIFFLIFIILILVYLFFSLIYFKSSFLPNTYINGKNYSFISREAFINKFNASIAGYKLKITDNDNINETISGIDIYLISNMDKQLDDIFENQNSWLWIFDFFRKNEIILDDAVIFNDERLLSKIDEFDFVINAGTEIGEPAKVVLNNGEYIIEPEKRGNEIIRTTLDSVIFSAVANLDETVDLTECKCFVEPVATKDADMVINACDSANKYINTNIVIELGEEAENVVVNKELISKWLCIDKDFNVFFDREQIKAFVEGYAVKFNTYGKTRSFPTVHGVTEQVVGGDFGWLINNDAEIDDLVRAIKAGENGVRQPVCHSTGLGHGENDWGNSYVEVDLTNQHMYVWIDGQRVMDSDVVTGTPIPSRITPPGVYKVKFKMKNVVLRGEDYETPVSYWMPFNRGIGFHDAIWQSAFGGTRYKDGFGSHGCVNLPLDVAGKLYDYVYVDMPVICYHTSAKGIVPVVTEATTTEITTEFTTESTTIQSTITTHITTVPAIETTTVEDITTEATTQVIEIQTDIIEPETITTTINNFN